MVRLAEAIVLVVASKGLAGESILRFFVFALTLVCLMLAASVRAPTPAQATTPTAITIDGSTARASGRMVGSITLNTPPRTAVGDYLLVWMERDGGVTSITAPAGWSATGSTVTDSGNNGTLYLYAKTATSGRC